MKKRELNRNCFKIERINGENFHNFHYFLKFLGKNKAFPSLFPKETIESSI